MPWIMQMVGFGLIFLGIAVALWVGFWVLLIVLGISAVMMFWSQMRDFLVTKGILNPTPGVPFQQPVEPGTKTIEGDFTRVDAADKTKVGQTKVE